MFKFEVWHKAIDFAELVYLKTSSIPSDERFGLTNQMSGKAISVSSSIAEGGSRTSEVDFARFVEIATGSLFEVVSESTIARRQQFLEDRDCATIYSLADEQRRMLSGLRRTFPGN